MRNNKRISLGEKHHPFTSQKLRSHRAKKREGTFYKISVSALGGGFLGSSLGLPGTLVGLIGGGLLGAWAGAKEETKNAA